MRAHVECAQRLRDGAGQPVDHQSAAGGERAGRGQRAGSYGQIAARGDLPRSRASLTRFGVAFSVFSPSDSLIAGAQRNASAACAPASRTGVV
jgi:hypothetical protein